MDFSQPVRGTITCNAISMQTVTSGTATMENTFLPVQYFFQSIQKIIRKKRMVLIAKNIATSPPSFAPSYPMPRHSKSPLQRGPV